MSKKYISKKYPRNKNSDLFLSKVFWELKKETSNGYFFKKKKRQEFARVSGLLPPEKIEPVKKSRAKKVEPVKKRR